jgi:ATP-dependent DNA ligase
VPAARHSSWLACGQPGLEGLVAKRLDSIYRLGERSKQWVKAKCPDWRVNHAPRRVSVKAVALDAQV